MNITELIDKWDDCVKKNKRFWKIITYNISLYLLSVCFFFTLKQIELVFFVNKAYKIKNKYYFKITNLAIVLNTAIHSKYWIII